MEELYLLRRTDTNQYYHSLTQMGHMLWVDEESQAQWFPNSELNKFLEKMAGWGNVTLDQLEKVSV